MNTLIVIGVLLMLAAVVVMYYKWTFEVHARVGAELEAHRLRNDLHAAMNARKAKSRGLAGKYRKAIEAHKTAREMWTPRLDADTALWSVLDSEAV